MFSVAVCDDNLTECCCIAKKIKEILEDMKIPFIIKQFANGKDLYRHQEVLILFFLILLWMV